METKHTPAPWFAVDYAGTYCIQNGPMYEDKDLLSYYSLCGPEQSVTKEEAEANAALMIAAPDLLEALTEIIPIALNWINENHPAMKKARAAIEKSKSLS